MPYYSTTWEIQDEKGIIHSGTEDEMQLAFDVLILNKSELKKSYGAYKAKQLTDEYSTNWTGYLKLCEVKRLYK